MSKREYPTLYIYSALDGDKGAIFTALSRLEAYQKADQLTIDLGMGGYNLLCIGTASDMIGDTNTIFLAKG